jgi:hypothetical protein
MNDREREDIVRAVDKVALPLTILALAWIVSNPAPPSETLEGEGGAG